MADFFDKLLHLATAGPFADCAEPMVERSERHYSAQWARVMKQYIKLARKIGGDATSDPRMIKLSRQLDAIDAKRRHKSKRSMDRWDALIKRDPKRAEALVDAEIERELSEADAAGTAKKLNQVIRQSGGIPRGVTDGAVSVYFAEKDLAKSKKFAKDAKNLGYRTSVSKKARSSDYAAFHGLEGPVWHVLAHWPGVFEGLSEDYAAADLDNWWKESRPKLVKGSRATRLSRMNGCIKSLRALRDGGIKVSGQSQTQLNPVPKRERDSEDQPVDKTPGVVDEAIKLPKPPSSLPKAIAAVVKKLLKTKPRIGGMYDREKKWADFAANVGGIAATAYEEALKLVGPSKAWSDPGSGGPDDPWSMYSPSSSGRKAEKKLSWGTVRSRSESGGHDAGREFVTVSINNLGDLKLDGSHHARLTVPTSLLSEGTYDQETGMSLSETIRRFRGLSEANTPAPAPGRTTPGGAQKPSKSRFAQTNTAGTPPADKEPRQAATNSTAGVSGPGYDASSREFVDVRYEHEEGYEFTQAEKGMGGDDFEGGGTLAEDEFDLAFAEAMLRNDPRLDGSDKRLKMFRESNISAPSTGRKNAGGKQMEPKSRFRKPYGGPGQDIYGPKGIPSDKEAMAAAANSTAGVKGPGYGPDGREEVDVRYEDEQPRPRPQPRPRAGAKEIVEDDDVGAFDPTQFDYPLDEMKER